jgi:hypothetical protein
MAREEMEREAARYARLRRGLKLRQGARPLRPRPLSLDIDCIERSQSVKGSQAAPKRRALDRSPPF